jgi:hypothetical protein
MNKLLILTLLLNAIITLNSYGRIGEDTKQMYERYGMPYSITTNHTNVSYTFTNNPNINVMVELYNNTKTIGRLIVKKNTKAFTDDEIKTILRNNDFVNVTPKYDNTNGDRLYQRIYGIYDNGRRVGISDYRNARVDSKTDKTLMISSKNAENLTAIELQHTTLKGL